MVKRIKVLHLEDDYLDAGLVKRCLIKSKIDPEVLVVDNKKSYIDALIEFTPDVVLADHTLVGFNSIEALHIFLQSGAKIPFILVTATMSEEFAVSMIKAGANDYVLKHRLEKLPNAIINSLKKIETETKLENQEKIRLRVKTDAIFMAHENERDQLSYELLENINQILAASNLYIDCAVNLADERISFLLKSKKYLLMGIDKVKDLSRVIIPLNLSESGLIDSLNNWLESKEKTNKMNFIKDWSNFSESLLSDKLQLTIYRIVQEQLNNVMRHSKAKNVHIKFEQKDANFELSILDDGVGFDPSIKTTGLGLQNIQSRADIYNGKMQVESGPGKGSMLKVVFPL